MYKTKKKPLSFLRKRNQKTYKQIEIDTAIEASMKRHPSRINQLKREAEKKSR